ncbi:cation-translocating P-type ATPase [Pseudonocardia asaccharolytica]|uniref:ATPase n=1 Tax=Pseudonocardia asaccharolytica DSM 44247 = NBRC 16224 TaxID=1123024 RepID=A0A511CX05_9PSEU|nr:cation-transporting P-type ATPase [Pseudonocardia asaccharolytica]GEL17096.1 ATPase [Pseudonocardia asaccharolytica DSM 44247 = NBRC 16224]
MRSRPSTDGAIADGSTAAHLDELSEAPWSLRAATVSRALGVDPEVGLGEVEAAARLRDVGPNDLPQKPPRTLLRSVLAQLGQTMILVLLAAAVLTAVTGDFTNCAVILLVIAVNTTVGVVQERRAVGAVAALRSLTTPVATVIRDGGARRVPTPELVPGDVLRVAEGDIVGSDARLLTAHDLQVDESPLTGESQPVERDPTGECPASAGVGDRKTMLHGGTLVTHGSGTAVVVGTGARTELGRIAGLLRERTAPDTPLQRRLAALGRRLSAAAAIGSAVVVLLGLVRGEPWELMVVAGISLAVAVIPESLPAVVALALAAATRRMAERGAIVRSLPAVEALGSVTVLASDKTGTLTTGRISCVAFWTPESGELTPDDPRAAAGPGVVTGTGPRALLEAAALCNDAHPGESGTEGALLTAALTGGLDVEGLRAQLPRTHVIPFDSVRRSMLTRHATPAGEIEVVKGAPEVLLDAAADPTAEAAVADWASSGRRVLAVAAGPPGATRLLGLLALADPVRPDARDAILATRTAGIRPIMITGDHPATAHAIARATGVSTDEDPPDDPERGLRAVYPRTDPGGKLGIVTAWQRAGHLVAMTGDGVNDAPALRASDIGVAMGHRGTEVAKEAADIVLTDDRLATVVAAIGEGRRVFDNVRRFVRYGLSGGLAELLVMLVGPFFGMPLPLLPGQILWVNLVTHGLPGVAIGSELAETDVLRRPPRPPREGVLTRQAWGDVLAIGTLITVGCLGLAVWAGTHGRPWQTMLFATLALTQLGVALTTRSDRIPFWRMSPHGNPFLFAAIAGSLAATIAGIYLPGLSDLLGTVPLDGLELGLCAAIGIVPAILIELVELVRARREDRARGVVAAGIG